MSTATRILTLGLAAMTLVLGFDGWAHLRAASALRDVANLARQEAASCRREEQTLRQRTRGLAARCDALERKSRDLNTAAAQAVAHRPLIATQARQELRAFDPKQEIQYLQRYRRFVSFRYVGLLRRLGLSPAQAARFAELMTEQQGRSLDLHAAAYAMALSPSDPVYRQLQASDTAQFQADMTALLGKDGFRQFERHEAEAPVREFVKTLLGTSVNLGEPMTPDQATQLTQIVDRCRSPAAASVSDSVLPSLTNVDWPAVEAQAATVLTPAQQEQLDAYINLAKYEALRSRLGDLMRSWVTDLKQRG